MSQSVLSAQRVKMSAPRRASGVSVNSFHTSEVKIIGNRRKQWVVEIF